MGGAAGEGEGGGNLQPQLRRTETISMPCASHEDVLEVTASTAKGHVWRFDKGSRLMDLKISTCLPCALLTTLDVIASIILAPSFARELIFVSLFVYLIPTMVFRSSVNIKYICI